jgi:hypothetical protein
MLWATARSCLQWIQALCVLSKYDRRPRLSLPPQAPLYGAPLGGARRRRARTGLRAR